MTSSEAPPGIFLSAEWRNLLMLNYEVDAGVLARHVPSGCELDPWQGRVLLSVVAFQFLNTRVLGCRIPLHQNFEEVNLRFYVRHRSESGWRRGVVFVKEIVPHRTIAFIARTIYGENYVALPMRHTVIEGSSTGVVSYEWRHGGVWEGARAKIAGPAIVPPAGSEETFITEHYWGYASQRNGSTVEYQVEHPRWGVWKAEEASLDCDVAELYGPEFKDALTSPPCSAFVADGSGIVVRHGRPL